MNPENTPETGNEKSIAAKTLQNKWLFYSAVGLTLVGLGMCLFGEALHIKYSGGALMSWALYGTISLVVFNAGLAIFGHAVVFKSQIDYKKNRKKFNQKRYGNKPRGGNNRNRKPKTSQFTPKDID
ncbi:MAG: hypothetical protein QMB24_15610 [Spirosomataceae bacterium]